MSNFTPYPKLARLAKADMVVTEKIDGTNAQILIEDGVIVMVGSRKRAIETNVPKITDADGKLICKAQARDNYGFAQWVEDNASGLVEFLGNGRHFGEWAGPGIQKNPLGLSERLFFLFNTHANPPPKFESIGHLVPQLRAVPIVGIHTFDLDTVHRWMRLVVGQSYVEESIEGAAGEGVVVSAFSSKFKMTADDRHKWEVETEDE